MKPFQPISVKDKLPHILIIPALWGIPILYGTVYLAPQLFPFFLLYSNHIQSVLRPPKIQDLADISKALRQKD